jgi:hypothetical protein
MSSNGFGRERTRVRPNTWGASEIMPRKNQPASAGTLAGSTGISDAAAIEAAALLIPRRAQGRHHIVCIRRNPAGGRQPWLVNFADIEFAIGDRRLRRIKSFLNVAEHRAITNRRLDVERLHALVRERPPQPIWQYMIGHVIAIIERGGGA